MEQSRRLSKREKEVITLLLQGMSNKLIAVSLGISKRTVEFHVKNIYTKFEVNSRIELILKLVNTTGIDEIEKLGQATVVTRDEIAENRTKHSTGWASVFKDTVSISGEESEMKNLWGRSQLSERFMIIVSASLVVSVVVASLLAWIEREFFLPSLSQPQIIEIATQQSRVTTTGKITSASVTATTLNQVSRLSCNYLDRFVSVGFYVVGLEDIDWCNPNASVWFVELRGTFPFLPGTADYVGVVLDTQGNFIRADSGPIQP